MTTQLFKNNATTTLSSSLASGTTSMSVGSSAAFPSPTGGDNFLCTLIRASDAAIEIISVTAVSGTTWTIVRAQEGTTALDFAAGDKVELRVTAGFLQGLQFGRLLNVQVITTTQTYTETPGTKNCYIIGIGGSGGGGASATTAAGELSSGVGGSAGASAELFCPVSTVSGKTFTVGASGAGGTTNGGAGAAGGTSSIDGGAVMNCPGGQGGAGGTAIAASVIVTPFSTGGSSPTGGNIRNVPTRYPAINVVTTTEKGKPFGGIGMFDNLGGFGGACTPSQGFVIGLQGAAGKFVIYEYA